MSIALIDNPNVASAEEAGLRYVSDDRPGYSRRRAGGGFCYYDAQGARITDARILKRIRALVIPPAWTEVWICPNPRGHIQATARDARGRKQYRYHPEWQQTRGQQKFTKTLAFARALPAMRKAVAKDIAGPPAALRTVLATIVRLLETTLIRVGNRTYAEQNKSYGLTTMRNRHVAVNGASLQFDFTGKSGKRHVVKLTDRRAARIVKTLQELPGQELFQYVDEAGERHTVESADVNAYLREISGDDFTAKDFRTWAGTVLAAWALSEFEKIDSQAAARRNITAAVKRVASELGNTPAVCRSAYIHPEILNSYLEGSLLDHLKRQIRAKLRSQLDGLTAEEAAVFVLLLNRLDVAKAA
nr:MULTISPECIES: DNA topoisomerase IB [Rhodomicrobium]